MLMMILRQVCGENANIGVAGSCALDSWLVNGDNAGNDIELTMTLESCEFGIVGIFQSGQQNLPTTKEWITLFGPFVANR